MSKTNIDIERLKTKVKRTLDNKYFIAYMSRFYFPELSRKQNRMISKSFFNNGTVSCIKDKHIEGVDGLYFMPYATTGFDYMYEPLTFKVTPIGNAPMIDINKTYTVDKDGVLGWCSSSRNSIKSMVDYFVEKMVNLEVILNTNIALQNMPFFVGVTPESKLKAKDLIDKLLRGEPVIIGDVDDLNAIQAIVTNAPYVADKLRTLYYDYENQLYTILGIDNTKMDGSNKQFVLTEQLDANIAEVNLYANDIVSRIQEFVDDINDTFSVNITLVDNLEKAESLYDNNEEGKQPEVKENQDEE